MSISFETTRARGEFFRWVRRPARFKRPAVCTSCKNSSGPRSSSVQGKAIIGCSDKLYQGQILNTRKSLVCLIDKMRQTGKQALAGNGKYSQVNPRLKRLVNSRNGPLIRTVAPDAVMKRLGPFQAHRNRKALIGSQSVGDIRWSGIFHWYSGKFSDSRYQRHNPGP